jgi:hypothetical protein
VSKLSSNIGVAAALMVVGVALVGFAFIQGGSDDDGGGDKAAAPQARRVGEALGAGPCGAEPCPASSDVSLAGGYEAPSVVVDPKDPNHMVVADNNLVGGHCAWHVSFDAGRTWKDGVFAPPPGYADCSLDSAGFLAAGNIAIGPSGTVYFTYVSAGAGATNESVLLSSSTDGGKTFGPSTVAVRGADSAPAYRRPSLAVAGGPGGQDRLLLSFWGCPKQPGSNREQCVQAVFANSTDGGKSFTNPVTSSPPPGGNSPGPAVLAPDGTIHLLYLRRVPPNDTQLVLARSSDGGRSFTTTDVGAYPELGGRYDSAKLVMGPKGELYTVFSYKPSGSFQVAFRRSLDNGATWEKEVRLNKNESGSYFSPNISVAPNGRIDVIFYGRSQKDTVPVGGVVADLGVSDTVLSTSSTNGGATFGVDRRVNYIDRGIDRRIGYWEEVGDWYTPSVASSDGTAILAWSDTRRGNKATDDNQETYLRRVDFGAAGERPE